MSDQFISIQQSAEALRMWLEPIEQILIDYGWARIDDMPNVWFNREGKTSFLAEALRGAIAAATAQHEARVKELQETVKRKDNYIEGITGALRKACEKLGCDNATDEVWKAAERLRNERDEARKLCEDACDAMGRSVCEAKSLPSIAESIYRSFKEATAERDALRTQLEFERMRLAACGVAAQSNTEQSIAQYRLKDDNPYRSGSYDDVCAAVDREMLLRTQLGQALDEVERLQPWAYFWLADTYEHIEGEAARIMNNRPASVAAMLAERTPKPVHSPNCATNRVGCTTRPVCDCGAEQKEATR